MNADDWVKIIGAIASGVLVVLGGQRVLWEKIHEYRREVNGRIDELLRATREAAHAQGKEEGRSEAARDFPSP